MKTIKSIGFALAVALGVSSLAMTTGCLDNLFNNITNSKGGANTESE